MNDDAAWLERAARHSRYAKRVLAREPALLPRGSLGEPYHRDRMLEELTASAPADEPALWRALRQLRTRVMVHIMARDLGNAAPLREVMDTVSALAEVAIGFALDRIDGWLAAQVGEPLDDAGRRQRLMVIAMGKLGGGELNVSSDIDLIFVYPEAGEIASARGTSAHEYFLRLGKRLIAALNEPTGDGFVFRVDMRLRPHGDSGPLAISLEMLEAYFTAHGRAWERHAWVKARVLTGDREADLQALVTPFVYRRHLDFGAIEAMRELHARIAAEVRRRDIADNIKLGPGGIREIEFLTQVFQLIRGGHEPWLRIRPTLATLGALAERGLIPNDARQSLEAAYHFLRQLEHRLQYLDDLQTQELPRQPEDRDRIAESMGADDYPAFLLLLQGHRDAVSRQFDAIFARESRATSDAAVAALDEATEEPAALAALAGLGFTDPPEARRKALAFRASSRVQRMSETGRSRLEQLLPRIVRVASGHANADETLDRLFRIVDSIGRRDSYLALLLEYPRALAAVAGLVSLSPWACDYLARYPMLLDELIDRSQLAVPDWKTLDADLGRALLQDDGNFEAQLDRLRHFKHAQTFRLLALDLAGSLTVEHLSDHLTDLAGLLLGHVLQLAWQRLPSRHRDVPLFAVIGYGKLGSKELGYESDLDLIFLYEDDAPEASENYARLAQRMNGILNSRTGAGLLYDTDLRLRPDGASGLLVSRLSAFEDYQKAHAWTWEHQALTRARFVAGDPALGSSFEKLRMEILRQQRDPGPLRQDVSQMRRRMLEAHPNDTPLFDLKHDPGGIVDIEFAVQYMVLAQGCRHPALTENAGNIALLRLAESLGLVDRPLGGAAADAYRSYRRRQHALRLAGDRYARVPPEDFADERAAVSSLWRRIFYD